MTETEVNVKLTEPEAETEVKGKLVEPEPEEPSRMEDPRVPVVQDEPSIPQEQRPEEATEQDAATTTAEVEPDQAEPQLSIPRKERPEEPAQEDAAMTNTAKVDPQQAEEPQLSIPRKQRPAEPAKDTSESAADVVPEQQPALQLSIPRKERPADSSRDTGTTVSDPRSPSTLHRGITTVSGLPEGVIVPSTVDSNLLQGTILQALTELPVELINDALVEFDDAVHNKGGSIRNRGAYLYGVVKRYKSVTERAASGLGDDVMGKELTPAVQQRLEKLVQDGFCTREEMNDKIKSKMRMLSEKEALFAIDELASVNRDQIRNFSSYFMGILNRYMRGDKNRKADKSSHQSGRGRQDVYGRDDRRNHSHYGPKDRDQRRRHDDRGGHYGDRDDHSRRDRSRDRYDDDRRRSGGRRSNSPPNSYRDRPRYDPRQPQQQQQQQQQVPQQGQYGGYGSVPPPPPPRQGMPIMNTYAPPQQQQQPLQQPPQQQQQQQFLQQQTPQLFVQPNQQGFQQSLPQYVQQQATTPLGLPPVSSFVPQQQTMGAQQTMGSQQMQTAIGQAMGQQPAFMSNMQSPQPMGNQQPLSFMSNQQQSSLMSNQQQQQQPLGVSNVSYGAPAPANLQQQQPPGIPDIFGLADKAASAVQALQASKSLSASIVNTPAPQMTMQNPPMSYSNPVPSTSQQQPAWRGRKTAKLNELPITVQYAVQNLQATGHVDGPLDEGILGMIKELPEPVALQSLQRFSTIDKNVMRNKAGYLAGLLRREQENLRSR